MEPLTLIAIAAPYAASAVAQKCADKPVEEGWNFISSFIGNRFGRKTEAQDVSSESLLITEAEKNPEILQEAQRIYFSAPVLRRATLVAPVLSRSQILWVDDNPENNAFERETLRALESHTDTALSTEAAIDALQSKVYDLVISDMSRDSVSEEGLRLIDTMKRCHLPQQTILYVGYADKKRGTPQGAFGITHRPDELLHLIMDVLERQRV